MSLEWHPPPGGKRPTPLLSALVATEDFLVAIHASSPGSEALHHRAARSPKVWISRAACILQQRGRFC